MEYNDRMKAERIKKGYTQREIADKLNMTQQQWQKYETGKTELPTRYLAEFCKALNASADEILGLKD